MEYQVEFNNRDWFIQFGIAISILRRLRGMTQEQLAEKAHISRSYLSSIEAPATVTKFSVEVLLNIANALEIDPGELMQSIKFFASQKHI